MTPGYFENRLREEFTRRSSRNPRYSLRSYARSLGVSHSVLSLVLSGKRPASRNLIDIVMSQLGPVEPSAAETHVALSEGQYTVIADWVHYAILSLLELPAFRADARWIAKRLGVSPVSTERAWRQLIAAGLISRQGRRYRQAVPPITLDNRRPLKACSDLLRQHLHKAQASMDETPFAERSLNSTTFAMRREDVAYAENRLREFWRQLVRELEGRPRPDSVYVLNVNLFPVSRKEKP